MLLVVSAALNEKVYDMANVFKTNPDGELRKNGKLLGMNVEGVNTLNNIVTILGSAGLGMYAVSLAMKKGNGSIGFPRANKAPGITTTVTGFAVAVALILSGLTTSGIYDEVDTFKTPAQQEKAKTVKNVSIGFIAMGAVVPLLYIIKMVQDKKAGGGRAPFAPLLGGGNAYRPNNAASVFFTY